MWGRPGDWKEQVLAETATGPRELLDVWAQHMLLAAVERNPGLQDLPSTCRESMQGSG